MAIPSGLAGSVGIATEGTQGTAQTPDHFMEFNSESMKERLMMGARLSSITASAEIYAEGQLIISIAAPGATVPAHSASRMASPSSLVLPGSPQLIDLEQIGRAHV